MKAHQAVKIVKAMSKTKQHIVIVGGGMVGISLALMLAKHLPASAVDITLIEQFALNNPSSIQQPSFDDRSTALSAGTTNILQELGCWADLEQDAEKIKCVHVSDRGHFGGTRLLAQDYQLDAVGYVIENKQLGQALIKQLQQSSVTCLAPASVTQCKPKKAAYQLSVDSAAQEEKQQSYIDADLLLIADGAHSPLRSMLGIDVDSTDYQQSALIANVELEQDHRGIAYERFTDEGPIALLPLPDINHKHRAALVWTLPSAKAREISSASPEFIVQQLQQRLGFRMGNITGIGERKLYPLTLIQAREQIRSHMAIIGNAAHFLHPVAGQGFNLALRDCWVLTECLQHAQQQNQALGKLSILNNYLDRQVLDQDLTIGLTNSLVTLFSSTVLPKIVLRQLGLLSLNLLPVAKNQFAQKMMGLSVSS